MKSGVGGNVYTTCIRLSVSLKSLDMEVGVW